MGFSPLLATEAVYRATGETEMTVSSFDTGDDVWEELAWNVRELAALYESHMWHPELVELATSGTIPPPGPRGAINLAPTEVVRPTGASRQQYQELVERIEAGGSKVGGRSREMEGGRAPARGAPTGTDSSRDRTASGDRAPARGALTGTEGDGVAAGVPVAFAPYVLEQYAGMVGVSIRQSPSMNVLIDEYYAGAEWRDAMEVVRAPLRKILQTQRERSVRKAEVLQRELLASEEAARYRLQGDLLLAYQHEVQQGQASVTLQNLFEDTGEGRAAEVTIALDPRFDAVGNANRFFNKYHKLRRALALVPPQIEQNAVELATIEQLLADLMLAENPAEVALVRAEVQTAGYMRGKAGAKEKYVKPAKKAGKGKTAKGKPVLPGGGVPLHVQSRDGFTVLIGKNSRQNEVVTFQQATANDMWLHARGVPGAHVIIKAGGREIPRSTIEQAAKLAAYYSQARGSTSAAVDYTLQRYVRHMKGGGPGMVVYERERTLYVEPEGVLR